MSLRNNEDVADKVIDVKKVTTRILFAMGVAQILFLTSAVKVAKAGITGDTVDILVLYGYGINEDRVTIMELIANASWRWDRIVWVNDILDYEYLSKNKNKIIERLRDRLVVNQVDELWVCRMGEPEKIGIAAYYKADLVYYEDGLATYISEPEFPYILLHPFKIYRKLKLFILRLFVPFSSFKNSRFYRWPVKPISKTYLMLTDILPLPVHLNDIENNVVDKETINSVIKRINKVLCLDEKIDKSTNVNRLIKSVLVIGQAYYNSGAITWEHELSVYTNVCEKLVAAGYTPIWKEHPKNQKPYFPGIKKCIQEIETFAKDEDNLLPIEIIMAGTNVVACVSANSTSLFTLKYLYGIPAYTFVEDLELKGVLKPGVKLTIENIPPFDNLIHGAN